MSEPYSQPMHALSKVQQTGFSSSVSGSSAGPSTASNRATGGYNGSFSYDEEPVEDGYSAQDCFESPAGADSVVDGLASWFGGMAGPSGNIYQQQAPSSRSGLSDDEKALLKHGLSTMEKLAGEPRRSSPHDAMEPPQIRSSQVNTGMSVSYLRQMLDGQSGSNLNISL